MIAGSQLEPTWRERLWWWRWTGIVVLLTLAPYLLAAFLAPEGQVFMGSLLNTDDTAQFLVAMRQGRDGRWLYQNPFTPESTRPALMYPLYMLWAKLVGWTGLAPIAAYHLLRVLGTVVLLVVIAALVRTLLVRQARAGLWQTAFLIAVFSSGLGWAAAFLPGEMGTRLMADLSLIEVTTFQSFYVVPHLAWGLMFELLAMLCFLRALEHAPGTRRFWLWSLAGGLSCAGIGFSHPFALVVVCAVLGGVVGLALLTRQTWGKAALWSASTILAPGAPLLIYYALFFGRDPLWRSTHVAGNATGSPCLLASAFGYGLVLAMALVGAVWVIRAGRWRDQKLGFLLAWVAIQAGLPYLPVPFQGRFAAGWHFALSVLAALGLERLVARVPPDRAERVRNVLVILTVPSTILILLVGPYMALSRGDYPFYLAQGELQAVDWLAQASGGDDVVLASYAMGNTIPMRAPCRVFAGHQFGTYRLHEKLALVGEFYDARTPDDRRMAILREYGVSHVYHGGFERQIGAFDPMKADYLERVYAEQGTSIYRVVE